VIGQMIRRAACGALFDWPASDERGNLVGLEWIEKRPHHKPFVCFTSSLAVFLAKQPAIGRSFGAFFPDYNTACKPSASR